MDPLKELIIQSRNWASVDRGQTLFVLVAHALQDIFGMDAGIFIYRKQFLVEGQESKLKVYESWGFNCSVSQLTESIVDGVWFTGDTSAAPERWLPVTHQPFVWQDIWLDAEVQYVGAWNLIVKERPVGAIVLGRKSAPDNVAADIMSACATYVSLVLEMLTERRIAEHASQHDPLTNIYNRRGFTHKLHQQVKESEVSFVVGLLDVNDFKSINDNFGHSGGDATLIEVAEILRDNLEHQGICGRFGGDEFVFAVPNDDLEINGVTNIVISWFENKRYTVSVGCARWEYPQMELDTCFKIADQRLYKKKLE